MKQLKNNLLSFNDMSEIISKEKGEIYKPTNTSILPFVEDLIKEENTVLTFMSKDKKDLIVLECCYINNLVKPKNHTGVLKNFKKFIILQKPNMNKPICNETDVFEFVKNITYKISKSDREKFIEFEINWSSINDNK